MSNLSITSSSDSTMLSVPKLRDDGSNWMDYEPWICRAMGSKGLWMHIEGIAIAPKAYVIVNSIPVLSDGKTKATSEQLETREARIIPSSTHHPVNHVNLPWSHYQKFENSKGNGGIKLKTMLLPRAHSISLTWKTSWPVCVLLTLMTLQRISWD